MLVYLNIIGYGHVTEEYESTKYGHHILQDGYSICIYLVKDMAQYRVFGNCAIYLHVSLPIDNLF